MTLYDVLSAEVEVVIVGLTGNIETSVEDLSQDDDLDITLFDSTFKAFRYLEEQDPALRDSKAVICDADLLSREGFLFVHNLRRDPELCNVPVIAIDRTGRQHGPTFLRNGVDDCYRAPVSWRVLRTRITQIREYRLFLLDECEPAATEDVFAIPRGKRVFDIVFALGAIAFFALPMLLIAIAIKLTSSGAIIYRSKRIGTGYAKFDFLKFRSMVPGADRQVDQLMALNQYGSDGVFLKVKNDPRVTWIGRLIRNTSLDELPQLFNVLRGDMSIVGNRPLPLREAEQLTSEDWSERFLAPAGITGKWQTSGRGKDTMDVASRMTLDIEYARSYSALEDLKILFKTFGAMKQDANV